METQTKQKFAKDLYLQADKSQTQIAEILDVNRKTIYLWCKKGKWEETKIAIRQSPGAILQSLYNHYDEVNKKIAGRDDKCPTMNEIDMLRKLLRMTKDLAKKNTGFYIEAFEELSYFIGNDDPAFKKKYAKFASDFVNGTFGDHNFYTTGREMENLTEIHENIKKDEDKLAKEIAKEEESGEYIFDGYSFVPVSEFAEDHYPFTNDITHQPAESKLPAEKPGFNAPTKPQTGKNGASGMPVPNPTEPLTVNALSEKHIETECPISETKKSENNETSVGAIPCGRPALGNSPAGENSAAYYATLPPDKRPAPFREGNIIWINHAKDLDNYEKHLKMSDSICYYPDVDPGLRYTR